MSKKIFFKIFCISLVFCIFFGCSSQKSAQPDAHSSTVFAMDTVMELTVYGSEDALKMGENLISELEQKLSSTSPDSDIYKVNHSGTGTVSADTYELLESALKLCDRSKGALDISIYPVVQAWGFTTDENKVPTKNELAKLLPLVDYNKITLGKNNSVTLDEKMKIDLGSVAKGYTGDRLAKLLSENGIKSAVLNLGGNVHVLGTKPDGAPWRVGITNPTGEGYAGAVEVVDKAVVTSGGYERFFEHNGVRYHHIIDPETGYPAENDLLSVTIIGDDGVVCDALSTALFVMGSGKATQFWKESGDFEAIFITADGILITEGLENAFSPLGNYKNAKVSILHRDEK